MIEFINTIKEDSVTMAIIAISFFLVAVILFVYDLLVLRRMRNKLHRDIFIAEDSIHRSLNTIQKDIHTYIQHLKNTKHKRMLTNEEEIFMSHFEDRIKSLYSSIDRR